MKKGIRNTCWYLSLFLSGVTFRRLFEGDYESLKILFPIVFVTFFASYILARITD